MSQVVRVLAQCCCLFLLILPLLANKGCGEALEEAGQEEVNSNVLDRPHTEGESAPAGSETEEGAGEIVPGTKILESGGPEVKSAYPPEGTSE